MTFTTRRSVLALTAVAGLLGAPSAVAAPALPVSGAPTVEILRVCPAGESDPRAFTPVTIPDRGGDDPRAFTPVTIPDRAPGC